MINPFIMFDVSKYFALASWLLLLVSLFVPKTRRMIWPFIGFVAPVLLCLCYILMVWDGWSYLTLPYSFVELKGVHDLYANFGPLTASWLHFLALDLFAGAWMVRDGVGRNMPLPAIFIALPFTLVFAPAGLLLYILLRYMFAARAPKG